MSAMIFVLNAANVVWQTKSIPSCLSPPSSLLLCLFYYFLLILPIFIMISWRIRHNLHGIEYGEQMKWAPPKHRHIFRCYTHYVLKENQIKGKTFTAPNLHVLKIYVSVCIIYNFRTRNIHSHRDTYERKKSTQIHTYICASTFKNEIHIAGSILLKLNP